MRVLTRVCSSVVSAWTCVLALTLAAVPPCLAQAGQQPASPGVVISGTVRDAFNGNGIQGARVTLTSEGQTTITYTDDVGAFTVAGDATILSLRVTKAGHIPTILQGGLRTPITVALMPAASVTGRVLDHAGAAVSGVTVVARVVDGDKSAPVLYATDTDDIGRYRIGQLPQGKVELAVVDGWRVSGAADVALAMEHQAAKTGEAVGPQAISPAQAIQLQRGEERVGVDLTLNSSPPSCGLRAPAASQGVKATSLHGTVLTVEGQPIPCASVSIIGENGLPRLSIADELGRFSVAEEGTTDVVLRASKLGYVTTSIRVSRAARGTLNDRHRIVLPRAAAVAGTIFDERGEPMSGVIVKALELRTSHGQTSALPASGIGARRTDDRGRYRLFGLTRGSYLIVVEAGPELTPADEGLRFAPMFYPGTVRPEEAASVVVDLAQDLQDLNVTYVPTRVSTVSGHALDPSGAPLAGTVSLIGRRGAGSGYFQPRRLQTKGDGSFTFSAVPPGDYALQAAGVSSGPFLFGSVPVSLNEEHPVSVTVPTSGGATVDGMILIEGSRENGVEPRLLVSALAQESEFVPRTGGLPPFSIEADGRFQIRHVFGARRLVLSSAPAGWYMKSAWIAGTDVLVHPCDFGMSSTVYQDVQIVISTEGAIVEGTSVDDRGSRLRHYDVVVFTVNRDKWFPGSQFVRVATSDNDGGFSLGGFPPGEYLVASTAANPGGVRIDWHDPDLLERLRSRSQTVTLSDGQRRSVSIRAIAPVAMKRIVDSK